MTSKFYAFFIGLSYAIHSFGIPVAGIALKPYQLLSVISSYNVRKKKLIVGVLLFLAIHVFVIYALQETITLDIAAYVFGYVVFIYSYLFLESIVASFRIVILANSLVYLMGVSLYFYALVTNSFVNIHTDVSERSALVNTIASFVFFDGEGVRYSGYALDPNFYAFYVNILLGVAFCLSKIHGYKLSKFFILLSAVSVLLTLSRVGIVSLVILLAAQAWAGSSNAKRILISVVITSVVSFFGFVSISLGRSIFNYDDAFESRLYVWYAHILNAIDIGVPYVGNGLSFDVIRYISVEEFNKSTHNTVLYMVYCLGFLIAGFLSLSWLLRLLSLLNSFVSDRWPLLALHLVYAFSILTLDLVFTVPFYLYIVFCYKYPLRFRSRI